MSRSRSTSSSGREIAMLFADLRGWTSFVDAVEPEGLGRRGELAGPDEAAGGQVLIAQRLYAEVENEVEVEPAGEFVLKGFRRPVAAFDVVGLTHGDVAL